MGVSRGSATDFVEWFNQRTETDDELAMLAASRALPLPGTGSDGRQEVWETNGGSPLAARFFIDYDDLSLANAAESGVPHSGRRCRSTLLTGWR